MVAVWTYKNHNNQPTTSSDQPTSTSNPVHHHLRPSSPPPYTSPPPPQTSPPPPQTQFTTTPDQPTTTLDPVTTTSDSAHHHLKPAPHHLRAAHHHLRPSSPPPQTSQPPPVHNLRPSPPPPWPACQSSSTLSRVNLVQWIIKSWFDEYVCQWSQTNCFYIVTSNSELETAFNICNIFASLELWSFWTVPSIRNINFLSISNRFQFLEMFHLLKSYNKRTILVQHCASLQSQGVAEHLRVRVCKKFPKEATDNSRATFLNIK